MMEKSKKLKYFYHNQLTRKLSIYMRLNIVFILARMCESHKFCVKEIVSCDYIYFVSPLFIDVAVVF